MKDIKYLFLLFVGITIWGFAIFGAIVFVSPKTETVVFVPQGEPTITLTYEQYRVLKCESGLKHEGVIGDSGASVGIAQFQQPTFDEFSKKYNLKLDINNPKDQIILMKRMFDDGFAERWTCYRIIRGFQQEGL